MNFRQDHRIEDIYKNINKIILWINRKAGENIISAAIGGLHSFALYTLNFTRSN